MAIRLIVFCLTLWAVAPVSAQDGFDKEALETWFAEHLTGARLVGSYTADDAPEGESPRPDSYTLKSVEKLEDGNWRFEAVIEYGEKPLTVPLNLPVVWAGDTPVITVTDLAIPFLGTFSARVLFHGDSYAGTWQGKDHGGHLWGRVVRDAAGAAVGGETGTLHWPQFRGRGARGVAEGFALPSHWDVATGANLRWKTLIPGLSHSCPVVWADRVYLVGAERADGEEAEQLVGLYGDIAPVTGEGEQRFFVMCLDRATGEVLWDVTAWEGEPAIMRHPKGSFAASTPATDGTCVVAFFGTEGLYCYELDGTLRWKKSFGVLDSGYFMVPEAQWGFASSPVIHGDRVIVQVDVQGQSFLAALALDDGSQVWRTDRDEVPTWGTPTVDVADGRSQVLVNGYHHMGGYDLETGEELWKLSGGGDIPVPTPIVEDGLVYLMNAHGRMAPILAIDAVARGELGFDADEHESVAWSYERRGNYMQTPILYGGLLYCCNDGGVLRCYDAKTGEEQYSERLGGGAVGFTGSAVAGDGKLYFTSEEGDVHIVVAGSEFELLTVSSLGETMLSTPAISEGTLFFRARRHLFAVGIVGPATEEEAAAVAAELAEMVKVDQDLRQRAIGGDSSLFAEINETDMRNTSRLRAIVAKYGWPTISAFGTEAAKDAWLLVQHADHAPEFQAAMLERMEPLVGEGEVDKASFAYLTDRVRVAQGRPQLYGTQFSMTAGNDGEERFGPTNGIEDAGEVDARRAEMGLSTLAEYERLLRERSMPDEGD